MIQQVNISSTLRPSSQIIGQRASLLAKQFFNRRDVVAIQNSANGRPLPVRPQNFEALILAHVAGNVASRATVTDNYNRVHSGHLRIGTYSPAMDGKTVFGALDLDGDGHKNPLKDPLGAALIIQSLVRKLGIVSYLERSGSGAGYHLWFLFDHPVDAAHVRNFLFDIAQGPFDLAKGGLADPRRSLGIEVFPKQNQPADGGLGNFLWLPLYHGGKPGCGVFLESSNDQLRILEPTDFSTIESERLNPWRTQVPPKTNRQASTSFHKPSVSDDSKCGYGPLRKIAHKCTTVRALIHQCRKPPVGGMTHVARRTLAQVARQAGIADESTAKLFKRQPNFNFAYSLIQVRSLNTNFMPSCQSACKNLGLCVYPCGPIKAQKRGTPIAFLEIKDANGAARE